MNTMELMKKFELNAKYSIKNYLWGELSKQISLLTLIENNEEKEESALIIIKYLQEAINKLNLTIQQLEENKNEQLKAKVEINKETEA